MLSVGEANITKGAGLCRLIQMVSSSASLSYAQIAEARVSPSQPLFFRLYKHKDDKVAEARVREVERLGYKAIFLTVDAIVSGNRERDVRAGWEQEEVERVAEEGEEKSTADLPRRRDDMEEVEMNVDVRGTAGALVANDDSNMTWKKVGKKAQALWSRPTIEADMHADNPVAAQYHQATNRHQRHSVCRCKYVLALLYSLLD